MGEYSRRYYEMYKDRFKLQYAEKKRREYEASGIPQDYYYTIYKNLNKWYSEGKDIKQEVKILYDNQDILNPLL